MIVGNDNKVQAVMTAGTAKKGAEGSVRDVVLVFGRTSVICLGNLLRDIVPCGDRDPSAVSRV